MNTTHNPAMRITDALSWYGKNLDASVKDFAETMGGTTEATERAREILDTFARLISAEINAPLPHHQTSLVRLNYYANGGDQS